MDKTTNIIPFPTKEEVRKRINESAKRLIERCEAEDKKCEMETIRPPRRKAA